MKNLWLIVPLLIAVTACAQVGRLVNYTISEGDVQQLVEQQIQQREFSLNFAGVTSALDVETVGVTIDENGDGKVHLSTSSVLNTQAFGRTYPVKADIKIAGVPSYSSTEHAIFLRNVSLEDSVIDTGAMRFSLNGISGEIYDFLNQWLDENPVYRFDPEDNRYRLLRDLGLDISVEPGRLRVTSSE
ncbi:hypothetical protein CWE09_09930 [Aliidiomarina minuta]|uniref:DUF1439 domain-containing protein n=1 Tax=Aliidiomarina minuta TaxID=880057 RepID=A0A432WA00_9GAMM|nr:DUF1439 domain-containing protein [Aliidiomarina minuta]RUO26987.1 hypothetical protein CWE09_09930 [Aliidiomarina minuta]